MPFPSMLHSPSSFEVSKPSLAGISWVCTGDSSTPGELRSHSNYLISCCYRSAHDQPPLIAQQTQFPLDEPAMIGEAFAADLLRAAAFAPGGDQLNAIRVDDPEYSRGGQERPRPVLMGREETKEPGTLGKPRKQWPIVARQPPIEGAVADAFERV